MKEKLMLFTKILDTVTNQIIVQVLIEDASMIYDRVLAIKDNKNTLSIEVFDTKSNLIFSK